MCVHPTTRSQPQSTQPVCAHLPYLPPHVSHPTSLPPTPPSGIVGTILGDLIAQLSSHALVTTPTEGGAAVAAEPPSGLRALRGGRGGHDEDDGYRAAKDRESKERERPLLPRRDGGGSGGGGGGRGGGGFLSG